MIKENESCKTTITKLTIYTKNDFNLVSKSCDSEEDPSIENFITSKNNKQFLNKYSMDGGSWPQELAAVSIYKAKKPVLITLHTQKWCCYPSPEGIVYSIDLYNIIKLNNGFKIMPVTQILGDNSSGLDGTSDEVMHFKLKDISSIKKWLDKNYK
ncbi:hypothetical protein I2F25_08720 [Acinetobacter pollinis]|uniref:Uncharacterized protein n=2 Tax=Acinetobacter pollinis TaxID=2605270 RepID=A0ABU6DTE6_9GAMM|nr:hypothetical protein [Acinetobacter pollinis]